MRDIECVDDRSEDLVGAVLDALAQSPLATARLRELLGTPHAYTVESLARAVGLSPKAVRNAIGRGDLDAVKRGGRWIISSSAAQRWSEPDRSGRFSRRSAHAGATPLADAVARFERQVPSSEVEQ